MKKIIQTANAPAPIGPYSQAVLKNGFLYTSGQIALHPETGALETQDIKDETHRVMKNLQAVLAEASMDFEDVIKTSIFVSDMENFAAINEVYASYFASEATAPARETVEVANLPKYVNVEISMIASK
ncbi:Rid family detoxifying hydrolase [Altibacter sp. HG106]|uniref:Rid family detoxifying hydrolase n=1 Tax=Altibacter sp. HG106 TaxID=3023937 RepID=UPI002350E485|nr:Rid family detoxifying hydrolase [Altibacter sp. HG106]MDC7993486.1 Rid family detoxifying hydrolase [Altibacter sp. HG106]